MELWRNPLVLEKTSTLTTGGGVATSPGALRATTPADTAPTTIHLTSSRIAEYRPTDRLAWRVGVSFDWLTGECGRFPPGE